MLRNILLPILVLIIISCAASHEKLEPYVGQDVQQVVADYGYPNVAFDMGNGRRDFQWTMNMPHSIPAQSISRGARTYSTDMFDPDVKMTNLVPTSGGQPAAAECTYTMITQWDETKKIWIVTGFQKPGTGC
jgi:hypothetical protein